MSLCYNLLSWWDPNTVFNINYVLNTLPNNPITFKIWILQDWIQLSNFQNDRAKRKENKRRQSNTHPPMGSEWLNGHEGCHRGWKKMPVTAVAHEIQQHFWKHEFRLERWLHERGAFHTSLRTQVQNPKTHIKVVWAWWLRYNSRRGRGSLEKNSYLK